MPPTLLTQTVLPLMDMAARMPAAALEAPWQWGSYDEEGVRFAFFRVLEELRALAARAEAAQEAGPQRQARRILGQYHAAYRDMQAALCGLDEAAMATAPAEGQWPVRRTLAHMLQADFGFYVCTQYGLERQRGGGQAPERVSEADWLRLAGLPEARLDEIFNGPVPDLLAAYETQHQRALADFSSVSEAELDLPVYYWEQEPHPLRFRLGRFEAHLRQHTVQIDKTRAAMGCLPTEPARLLRLVWAALAEAESALAQLGPDGGSLAVRGAQIVEPYLEVIGSA